MTGRAVALGRWNSIGQRLAILLAVTAALLSLLSWALVTSFAREAAERSQDQVLVASATTIAEALRSEQGQVRLELPYSAFAMLDALGQDRVFYRVATGTDTLTGYADLVPDELPRAPARVTSQTLDFRGETVRAVTVRRTVLADQRPVPVLVTVAQTRSGIDAISLGLSRSAALLSLAFFLIAVGLGTVAVRGSLRPLNEFAGAVARRGPADLRPLRRPAPRELEPLQTALNRLMERLGHSIRRSEEFIAEAAHRVRTPLATVRAQAELALHTVTKEDEKKMLRQMIRAVDESSRSASQLLDHATVNFRADALATEAIDLADLTPQVIDALRPTATLKDIDIRFASHGPSPLRGDPVLLESALRNVLDNAIKYSPEDTVIDVALSGDGALWRLQVRDHGRGFDADAIPALTERFRRGTNVDGIVGSGLGLTIARDAIEAHGGHLALAPNAEGRGACVSITLPSA